MPSLDGDRLGYITRGIYNILGTSEANGFTWYEIEKGLFCASKEGDWTVFLPKETVQKYSIYFPEVTNGDKAAIIALSDKLHLKYTVKEL